MRGMCCMQSFHKRGAAWSVKRFFPSNLFGRALLILVLPMLLSQAVIVHIFYDRHWSSVERNMANSVVGDISWLTQSYHELRDEREARWRCRKSSASDGR